MRPQVLNKGLFTEYVCKRSPKNNMFYPLVCSQVKNISFSEDFAHVLNEWSLTKNLKIHSSFFNYTAQKMKFSIKENVTKSTGNCEFGHIY